MLEVVLAVIAAESSFDEVRERLLEMFPQLPTADLERLLESGYTLAEMAGRYAVQRDETPPAPAARPPQRGG
jgi:phage gp29-like protein